MAFRPRRRLVGLFLAAGVAYFFATNSQVVWLYLLSAFFLALVPVGLVGPVLGVRRMAAGVERVSGSGFAAPLPQDRGRIFADDTVEILLAHQGRVDLADFGLAGVEGEVRVIDATETTLRLAFAAGPRGILQVPGLVVTTSWPLGVLSATRRIPLNMSIVKHPRYLLPAGAKRSRGAQHEGSAALRGSGDEFLGVREYRPGDSQRRVHWGTTARVGELMVVETAVEAHSPARYRLKVEEGACAAAFDLAVSVVASLAAGCVASGRPFTMVLPGSSGPTRRWADALAQLARLGLSGTRRATPGREETTIAASPDAVRLESATGSWSLPARASLEEARVVIEAAG